MARINRGAVAAVVDVVQRNKQAKKEEEREFREFQRRLAEIGLKKKLEEGTIDYDVSTGQFIQTTPQAQPNILSQIQDLSGYDTSINLDPTGQLKGMTLNRLSPVDQIRQSLMNASSGVQEAQAIPNQALIPQAIDQLQQTIPQTPFVQGPGGGFITSQQPFQASPESIVPREQVMGAFAPDIAAQIRAQKVAQAQAEMQRIQQLAQILGAVQPQMNPVVMADQGRLQTIGEVPKGAVVIKPGGGSGASDLIARARQRLAEKSGKASLPSDLPDPSGYKEGTVIEDDRTGKRYRLVQGQWQPI